MTSLRLEHIYKVYQGKKKGQEVPAVSDFNLESNQKRIHCLCWSFWLWQIHNIKNDRGSRRYYFWQIVY